MSRSLTPEHKAAMQAGRIKAREVAAGNVSDADPDEAFTVAAISWRNTKLLVKSGLKKGMKVVVGAKVKRGLGGKTGEIVGMNWADCEVQVKLDGESGMLWFGVGELVRA